MWQTSRSATGDVIKTQTIVANSVERVLAGTAVADFVLFCLTLFFVSVYFSGSDVTVEALI